MVLTRQRVLPLLNTAMVAPITSTERGLSSEVPVGTEEGLSRHSVVNLDHVQTVDQRRLHAYVGTLSEGKMRQFCRALALATACTYLEPFRSGGLPPSGRLALAVIAQEELAPLESEDTVGFS